MKALLLTFIVSLAAQAAQTIPLRSDRPFTIKEMEGVTTTCLKLVAEDLRSQLFRFVNHPPQDTPKEICQFYQGDARNSGSSKCEWQYKDEAAEYLVKINVGRSHTQRNLTLAYSTYGVDDYRVRLATDRFPLLGYELVKHADIDDLGDESNVFYTADKLKLELPDNYGNHVALTSDLHGHDQSQIYVDMTAYVSCLQQQVKQL